MVRSLSVCLTALLGLIVGASACSTPDPDPAPNEPVVRVFAPPEARLTRLLERQYLSSIERLLGPAARKAAIPPLDTQIQGYSSIASTQLSLSDTTVAQYDLSARSVAKAAIEDQKAVTNMLASCDASTESDETCLKTFVETFGRLAFRRPLSSEEANAYLDNAKNAAERLSDFYAGIESTISTMLQSPNFLYRVEIGEPDEDGKRRLTGYEMASRMSFFLLDTTPSSELLDAAEAGDLDTVEGIEKAATRLLDDPAAKAASEAFFIEYFELGELDSLSKDPTLFPNFSPELAESMKQETLKLIDSVIWNTSSSIGELFTANHTFVDERLAAHYGVKHEGNETWQKVTMPQKQKRSGIVTHASILAGHAHPTSTSVTHRGLFIMERFLCRTMPPPPPDVVTELPPTSTAPTMRERLAVHLENPTCAGCHATSDNLGLSLENFDSVGVFRTKENGATIDTRVETDLLGAFEGPQQLGEKLAESSVVKACIVRNLFRHATGRIETNGDLAVVDTLEAQFEASGHRYRQLLLDLVTSEVFTHKGDFTP